MEENIITVDIRVLVVDDNIVNSMVLSTMLERYGIQADIASSGMEAIQRVCNAKYDIILMDYLMPDMDGVETTKQIMFVSNGKSKPKVIGVSATVDAEVTELFISAGADCVLKKPVRTEDFDMKLRQYGFVKEEPGSSSTNSDGSVDSAGFLSSVEGLNYDEGISLMAGSLANYMKVLNVSLRNVSENYNKLDAIRNTGQLDAMSLHFHSLKGIFLNIGASSLASYSKAMEGAAKEFKRMYVRSQMDEYMESVKIFHDQLKDACENYSEKVMSSKSNVYMEEDEFMQKLSELKGNIEEFEYTGITEILEELLAGTKGQRLEKLQNIQDYIQDFQYDEAMEILCTML